MAAIKGHIVSKETKEKIGASLRGKPHPMASREGWFPKHSDKGCEFADLYLGVPRSGSRCLWCPFVDCIMQERDNRLKDFYLNWRDMVRWIYKYRKPTVEQLTYMFGTTPKVIRRIIGDGETERGYKCHGKF